MDDTNLQEQEDHAVDQIIDPDLQNLQEEEELMERENINQERANLEPQVVATRAPIGEKAHCPLCQKEFTRKKSVERHLKTVHKLSKQDVKRHMATVSTTLAECKKCFKWVADSGMTKHSRHCTGTVKDTPSSGAVPAQISTRDAVPKAFRKGGELCKPTYKAYLKKKDLKSINIPQKTFGQRLKTHMNRCQARRSQEALDEEKENLNEEKSEYENESENENSEVEPDKKRQRIDLEQSIVAKADLQKIDDKNEKEKNELLQQLKRLLLENEKLTCALEKKKAESELVSNELERYRLEIKVLKKEQRKERWENSNILKEKESELKHVNDEVWEEGQEG